jgi:Domain of unknown function (DUF4124)
LNSRPYLALLALVAFALPSASFAQSKEGPKLYKWVDEKGVVHYGDSIPPEYAKRDRDVLNDKGVHVGFEEGEITDEERAAIARKEAAAAAVRAAKAEEARRDRMLLETYGSVSDIEDLRDRRLQLLDSQIKVTEAYLGNLRKRLVTLQEEASNYKPYTTRENAPHIPEKLALDISRTADSINGYEATLARTRADQEVLRAAFDKDIRRFKELKGG